VNFVQAIYLAGVLAGLARTDAAPASRVGLALLWPLGPAAFIVTLAVLLAASVIAFPLFWAAVAALVLLLGVVL
jgi:hypothetical protein